MLLLMSTKELMKSSIIKIFLAQTGGQCIFEYENGVPFSYTGTRAAHGNILDLHLGGVANGLYMEKKLI